MNIQGDLVITIHFDLYSSKLIQIKIQYFTANFVEATVFGREQTINSLSHFVNGKTEFKFESKNLME